MLAVIETHPIQYHAPVYRALQAEHGIAVTAIYGSDFSLRRYRDPEFGTAFAWDCDLTSGYDQRFLSRAEDGVSPEVSQISARGVGAALRALSPDATLVTGYSPAFHRHALYAAWRLGRPILFRAETSTDVQREGTLVGVARRALLRTAYRRCARVLYIGARARDHYLAHGVDDSRLVFSPYCVDTTPFAADETARTRMRSAARRSWGFADDELVVLFSGKLSQRKGVDLVVEAARRLDRTRGTRVSVLFAGAGAEQGALEARARVDPAVKVVFAGFQQQGALSEVFHAADLLVLPSRHSETWGLVVNEALHHGVPCVVSDRVGCGPDLIDERTGAVCERDSVTSLAAAIERTARLAGLPGTRAACRAKVAAYTVSRAAAGIAQAYTDVVARRAAS